jgi:hypothetical protein
MRKNKRRRTGNIKPTNTHTVTQRIRPISSPTKNEPPHQPDYLLEDHPELGIPSRAENGESPKEEHRAKK